MDEQVDVYQRNVYSLWDLFGQIGGIFEIMQIFGGVLVGYFNVRFLNVSFVNTFLQNLYEIKNKERKKENLDLKFEEGKIKSTNRTQQLKSVKSNLKKKKNGFKRFSLFEDFKGIGRKTSQTKVSTNNDFSELNPNFIDVKNEI